MKKRSGGILISLLALYLFLRNASYTVLVPASPPPTPAAQFFPKMDLPRHVPRKIPHRYHHLRGLDILFSKEKKTHEARRAWLHMRDLLPRSDALPETRNGVREAAAAWTDLISEKPISEVSPELLLNCPSSISRNTGNFSLDIPCGFVQDSAFTVVGVPGSGGFQIELFGKDNSSAVVLRYTVIFEGMNGGPEISQNSKSGNGGWGAEERCPSLSSKTNLTVDGLLHCNEFSGRGDEKLNGTKPVSANFPFVEGQAFTATLWAGLHGFHMTVNGRHETSFLYRKGLEPWMVTRVNISGDVDLLSLIANGLPAPDNINLMSEVEKLRAPPIIKNSLLLLIGVFSKGNNFKQRMALRRSWMQFDAVRSGEVAVRFFTGLDKTRPVNLELWKEAETYGDIQLMPFVDYYSLLTLKTIAICIFGTEVLPAKYIMKTDDDAFVRIDQVTSTLRTRNSSGLLYGLIAYESYPHRDEESKWFITEEEWPDPTYPPWAHGPGYIVSNDIANFVVQGHKNLSLHLFKLEDVAMGIWVDQFKTSGNQVGYINDDRFFNNGCDDGYILAHYQSPRLILCLWDKLQTMSDPSAEPTCCEY